MSQSSFLEWDLSKEDSDRLVRLARFLLRVGLARRLANCRFSKDVCTRGWQRNRMVLMMMTMKIKGDAGPKYARHKPKRNGKQNKAKMR